MGCIVKPQDRQRKREREERRQKKTNNDPEKYVFLPIVESEGAKKFPTETFREETLSPKELPKNNLSFCQPRSNKTKKERRQHFALLQHHDQNPHQDVYVTQFGPTKLKTQKEKGTAFRATSAPGIDPKKRLGDNLIHKNLSIQNPKTNRAFPRR